MARQTKKVALVKGTRLRVTRLDACGRPQYGDDAVVTSEGFISVGFTANVNATDEVRVQNAAGKTIVYEAPVSSLSGYGVEIAMAEVDPELFALVTGQELVLDSDGNPVGLDIDTQLTLEGQGFALEVWAGSPSGDACDDVASEGTYGYLLLPFLTGGILGDFSIENGGITFTITGANTKDGNAWGSGPFNVQLNAGSPKVAGPLVQPIGTTIALRLMLVEVAPPVAETGSRPLLRRSDVSLVSLTPTVTAGSRNVSFLPLADPAPGVGVYYEFGDGTWDYVTTSTGGTSHLFPVAGTYTVRASTNGVFISTSVTVTGA